TPRSSRPCRPNMINAQPRRLFSLSMVPEDVLVWLPDILAAAAEAEGLEVHRFQRDVAGEDHQVGPRDLAAVFLLDRPEQPARLVEVGVTGPAAGRRKALLHRPAAAAAARDRRAAS